MPKLSDTMTEGTVVRWLKQVGDQVEIGDEIAEIETDKATMAMEAFDEGILSEILVEEGGKAEIGATLAVLREEGEEPETAEPSDEKPVSDPLENLKPVAVGAKIPDPLPEPTPEPEPEPTPDPAPEPITVSEPAPAAASSERIKASPLARKMAESSGVDLASVKGTGPGGRIVKKDIEAATAGAAAPTPVPAPAPAPTPTPSPTPTPTPAVVASGEDQRVELSNLRRIIAERLLTSKTTIPHFYLHVEADAAPLMDIRKQVNAQAEVTHGNKYTVNDFVLKAVINALQAVPAVNASFNGDHIVQFGHIGVAVAIAVDALGAEHVTAFFMPSQYTADQSYEDSLKLIQNLGVRMEVLPIKAALDQYLASLGPLFEGREPDTTEENLQARIRGNLLMAASNKFGWIVLTTGNKSEMAMGYATLYGDMAGGFAVLKDVPKTTVYELCRWRNGQGQAFGTAEDVIPTAILDKPPSAELRKDQLDADSLPAYEVLDPVVEAYVEDDQSYQEMVDRGFDPQVIRQVIAAVDRNEYKRRQAPPGVKITHRAFGKDRRLPIVNRYRQHDVGT